jgi:hypothetical protein
MRPSAYYDCVVEVMEELFKSRVDCVDSVDPYEPRC